MYALAEGSFAHAVHFEARVSHISTCNKESDCQGIYLVTMKQ